jgi:hypothetical protein
MPRYSAICLRKRRVSPSRKIFPITKGEEDKQIPRKICDFPGCLKGMGSPGKYKKLVYHPGLVYTTSLQEYTFGGVS